MTGMYDETMIPSKREDAREGLDFVLLPCDVDEAIKRFKKKPYKKQDPDNFTCCVLAEAAKRIFGAAHLSVGHRNVYIAHPSDECSTRYKIGEGKRSAVEVWDQFVDGDTTEKQVRSFVGDGIHVRFRAPAESERLDTMRENWHKKKHQYRENTGRKQRRGGPPTEFESISRNGLRVNRVKDA